VFLANLSFPNLKMIDTIIQFKAFVEAAQKCRTDRVDLPAAPIVQFETFVSAALPMAVAHLKQILPRLKGRIEVLARWRSAHDLLRAAGVSYVENAYANLMSWALDPATHPPTAALRQRCWLQAIGIDLPCNEECCQPITQLVTDDGIPDLVLRFKNLIVIVEAKTGTLEHDTPTSALPQTIAYAASVRAHWRVDHSTALETVFITPDGSAAANPKAKRSTYAGFAIAFAAALNSHPLPPETRAAFAMLITHFLSCSSSSGPATNQMLDQVTTWSTQADWSDDVQVLGHMRMLQRAVTHLRIEEQP
jgi:hypothetical protein